MKSVFNRRIVWLLIVLMLCAAAPLWALAAAADAYDPEKMTAEDLYYEALLEAETLVPRATEGVYAILYEDGCLVFQGNDTPEDGREVTKTYSVDMAGYASAEDVPWNAERGSIEQVNFSSQIMPTSVAYWFSGCEQLTALSGIDNLKLDQATSMQELFSGCRSLAGLDLIVNNKGAWNTAAVQNMSGLFAGCASLTSLNLSTLNTGAVTNLEGAFAGCTGLEKMSLTLWDVSAATNLSSLFSGCSSLTEIDLIGWDTASVTDMSEMFYQCAALKTIHASGSFATVQVTDSADMFTGCTSLKGGSGTEYDAAFTDKTYARADTGTVKGYFSEGVFAILYADGTFVFQYGDTPDGREVAAAFTVDMIDGYAMTGRQLTNAPWFNSREQITKVDFADRIAPVSASLWLYKCANLTEVIHAENLDLSRATSMMDLFYGCVNLKTVDVSTWDTSCIRDAHGVFYDCGKLISLDVSGWDTANMADMSGLFNGCSSLTELDVSGFDTSNVTHFGSMFYRCANVRELDVSRFNTEKAQRLGQMFDGCAQITELDLSNWDTANAFHFARLFAGATNLKTIWASEKFVVDEQAIQDGFALGVDRGADVFADCLALTGGNGMTYDAERVDYHYARIDAAGAPGYFTAKTLRLADELPQTQAGSPVDRAALSRLSTLSVRLDCTDPQSTTAIFVAAFYDGSGRMLKAFSARRTIEPGTETVTIPASGVSSDAAELRLFALDTHYVPACVSRRFRLE